MIKRVSHNDKEYMIDTTPEGRFAMAEVTQMVSNDANGAFADVWEYATGQRLQNVRHYVVEGDELVNLVVEKLGYKFSRSKAYKRLYDSCEYQWRRARR